MCLLEGVAESSVRLAGLKSKLATVENAADLAALAVESSVCARAGDAGSERAAASLSKGARHCRRPASDAQAIDP